MEDAGCVGGNNSAKRCRDESEEAPEAKKIRPADFILDILEDVDPADRGAASVDGDLASVMKSFEEEIAAFSPAQMEQQESQKGDGASETLASALTEGQRESDLGYLLEASDDELGLPPSVPSSSDEGEGTEGDDGNQGAVGNQEPAGLGQIWRLEDEIPGSYDAFDFGIFGQDGRVAGGDDSVGFDGGLFDYADLESFGASDFSDFSWQPESLPAL